MSQQPDRKFVTTEGAPAVEPFASIMEYAERLGSRHLWMLQQLEKLRERTDRCLIAPVLRAGAIGELRQRAGRGRRLELAKQMRELRRRAAHAINWS